MSDEEIAVRLTAAIVTGLMNQAPPRPALPGEPDAEYLMAKTAVAVYRTVLRELRS